MEENDPENILQITQGYLLHTFGGLHVFQKLGGGGVENSI